MTGGGEPGEGPQPPAPRPQGRLSARAQGPLEAQDERAAGWPWAHAGAQDAASSSWTPGSSGLLMPSPHPFFLFRGSKGQEGPQGSEHTLRKDTLPHTPRHPKLTFLHRGPLLVSLPQILAYNTPWLPIAKR